MVCIQNYQNFFILHLRGVGLKIKKKLPNLPKPCRNLSCLIASCVHSRYVRKDGRLPFGQNKKETSPKSL